MGVDKSWLIEMIQMSTHNLEKEVNIIFIINEPRHEKTGLRGFRPGPTQTRLYSHTRWLEA